MFIKHLIRTKTKFNENIFNCLERLRQTSHFLVFSLINPAYHCPAYHCLQFHIVFIFGRKLTYLSHEFADADSEKNTFSAKHTSLINPSKISFIFPSN